MTRNEVLNLMSEMEAFVTGRTMAVVRRIINLAYSHLLDGRDFTFNQDEDLDKAIDNLLIQLSDAIQEEIDARIRLTAEEEDMDDVLLYAHRAIDGHDLQWRMDMHASNLKQALETYIQEKRREKRTDMVSGFLAWLALNKQNFGRGMDSNPVRGMTLLAQNTIYDGYVHGDIMYYERDGAVGYTIHRGSDYHCPDCDSMCFGSNGKHRLYSFEEECPVPRHPHCVCIVQPVYAEQLIL